MEKKFSSDSQRQNCSRIRNLRSKPAGALVSVFGKKRPGNLALNGDGVFQKPIADKSSIYFGSRDGFCYCLNREDHNVRWRFAPGQPRRGQARRD